MEKIFVFQKKSISEMENLLIPDSLSEEGKAKITTTQCEHSFHSKCLFAWQCDHGKRHCPSCRADLVTGEHQEAGGASAVAEEEETVTMTLKTKGGVTEVQSLRQRVKELELMLQHRSEKAVILAGGAGEEVLSGGL